MTNRTALNFWVDVLSLVVLVGLTITGGLIHFVLPPGTGHSHSINGLGRHDFGQLHFILALAALVLLVAHLVLHWNWICCVIARSAGRSAPARRQRQVWGLALLLGTALLLGGGLWWGTQSVERTAGSTMDGTAGFAHAKHLEDCPAGASISGRTSLAEAARRCRLGIAELKRRLSLPADIAGHERLGRLKRSYGIAIHDVRRLACRVFTPNVGAHRAPRGQIGRGAR